MSPDAMTKLAECLNATGEPSVIVMDDAASILIVSPTTPSSKSVIAVVPAVLNDLPPPTVGVVSVVVNVTVVSAVYPVTLAAPP